MPVTPRIRFFNYFRAILKLLNSEGLLATFTRDKGYDNFFVKCLPQNYQYQKGSFHLAKRNGIQYRLDLSEYMEWVIYFGLNVEDRIGLYPLIKKGMVVFDIGTNIGETLLNFAMLTGIDGLVCGFEPVEENFKKCQYNVSLNPFKNIYVHQLALSDRREMLYFGLAENKNSGGIFMNKEEKEGRLSIQAITLDEFVEEHKIEKIDFIKIDVEGFEYNVIKGAEKTINRFKPVLYIEMDESNLKRQGASPGNIISFLLANGYKTKRANEKRGIKSDPLHYDLVCEYTIQ